MICWQSRGKQIRGRMLSVLWLSPMVLTISTFQVTRCRRNHLWWAPGTCLNSLALLERAVLVNYFVKNKGASVMDPKLVPPQSLHVEILTPDVMALGAPSEGDSRSWEGGPREPVSLWAALSALCPMRVHRKDTRKPSPERDLPTPWSWTPQPLDCEKHVSVVFSRPVYGYRYSGLS